MVVRARVQTMVAVGWVALVGLSAASCGELASGQYRGEPLFEVEGFIGRFTTIPRELLDQPKRISLFWSPSGETQVPVEMLVEQPEVSVEIEALSNFTLSLYHPPQPEAMLAQEPALGVALVLVYVDVDGNGRYSAAQGDVLIGGSVDQVLFYAPEPIPAERSLTGLPIPQGFYLVETPLFCQELEDGVALCESEVSDVLGRSCNDDTGCGDAGLCIWPEPSDDNIAGSCMLLDDALECQPRGGVELPFGDLWAPACTSQSDCEAYPEHTCDGFEGACVLTPGARLCDAESGVQPGLPCTMDTDCGPLGTCLLEDMGRLYPGGYCIYAAHRLGCIPSEGTQLCMDTCAVDLSFDGYTTCVEQSCGEGGESMFWHQSCRQDDDCRADYQCDPFSRTCNAVLEAELIIATDFALELDLFPLCDDSLL
ncbi:MAG: hypothetical protein AAFX99_19325 [Myxococcota bacterium]